MRSGWKEADPDFPNLNEAKADTEAAGTGKHCVGRVADAERLIFSAMMTQVQAECPGQRSMLWIGRVRFDRHKRAALTPDMGRMEPIGPRFGHSLGIVAWLFG